MIIQENDFLINEAELYDLAQHIQPDKSRLAVLPSEAPATPSGIVQDFEHLPEEKRDYLSAIVRGLAYPVRVMRLHYSIADETISRQVIAWRGDIDEVVTLAGNGNVWRLGTSSEFGVRMLIKEVLGAGSALRRDPLAVSLSSVAVLVFLGILEQLRYARLYSTLMSQAPVEVFAPADVLGRMRQSVKEDFRWPLAMFEKVLPARMMETVQLEDINDGLSELAKVELVEACDDKGLLYELTPSGFMVADGVLHEVSKAALCVTQCRSDGVMGHDAVLLVRSAFYLFLFELSGEAGVLATLDEEGADLFLKKTMETPDAEIISAAALMPVETPAAKPVVAEHKPAPEAPTAVPAALVCTNCGSALKPGTRFCPECGQKVGAAPVAQVKAEPAPSPMAGVCPHCGKPVKPGAKFCRSCGEKIQ